MMMSGVLGAGTGWPPPGWHFSIYWTFVVFLFFSFLFFSYLSFFFFLIFICFCFCFATNAEADRHERRWTSERVNEQRRPLFPSCILYFIALLHTPQLLSTWIDLKFTFHPPVEYIPLISPLIYLSLSISLSFFLSFFLSLSSCAFIPKWNTISWVLEDIVLWLFPVGFNWNLNT